MSPRSIRRAAERRQQKLERKQARLAAATNLAPPASNHPDPLEAEFSPELITEARALRERIAARAERNRANAAHSTGPVTPSGKLASSRNALRHGLASGQLLIAGEDPAAFDALLAGLRMDFQPVNSIEELLVRQMAQSHWIEQRALRLQNDCFTSEGLDEKRLALFLRYQTTHQRAFFKALHELTRLQKERRRSAVRSPQVNGFVSQGSAAPPHSPQNTLDSGFVSQDSLAPEPRSVPRTAEAA